ncbi:hypothetical protein [Herbaspirillum huttiense]|uniref:Uncharacterized protein n=1 Tax=Herbaspirillum huttiense subsp. lycopersici TaxID=3074428 RepID=A0ABU2EUU7_9BURK|nr:hypothetical protein [Herbaspirillum huttiense]MDR9851942.1 hypothetical protein [Herbaspirillum huttiense SE1]
MLITDIAWKIKGVPKALLAPLVPWHSVLFDINEPCFAVMPRTGEPGRQTYVRLFSDIEQVVDHMHAIPGVAYALSQKDNELRMTKVKAVGSYPCPQTGIKLKVYFDDSEQPWPAHSGQPQFSSKLPFNVEVSFF